MSTMETINNRILIIDDNPAIHADFRKILQGAPAATSPLLEAEKLFYGAATAASSERCYGVDAANQGLEALELIRLADGEKKPYALAFVDMRMPPGLDGIETIVAIWKEFPDLQIALCTAYSDYSWEQMLQRLGMSDNLLILKKPFDNIEVLQIACALTGKWNAQQRRKLAESEQRRLTEELKAKNIELEADIAARKRLEKELVEARKTAEQASEAKSSFLANMSHEIRTPINVIMGFNYLLQQTGLTERQSGYTSKVDLATGNLLRLINSILDISKVEAGKIELEHIDFTLDEVLSKVTQLTSALVLQKSLKFTVDVAPKTPTRLIGDPLRLEQVLLNLASNAIKFTEAGQVSISVNLQEQSESTVVLKFHVRDSGMGVSKSGLHKLFEPFVQADSTTTRKHGGTGLGLAISKQFVTLMHGQFEVESKAGHGSDFSFTARFDEGTAPKSQYAEDSRQRALLIDPVESSRGQVAGLLAELNLNVTACASLEHSLLEIVRGDIDRPSNFDVLLIDGSESEKDWLTDILRIRDEFVDRVSPKIILIAAPAMTDHMASCLKIGVDDIVFKPLTRSSVFDSIARAETKKAAQNKTGNVNGIHLFPRNSLLQGTRVLLVEDDEINQQIASEVLSVVGCELIIASSGAEALSMITNSFADDEFDAVLMDLHMPGMDGLAVTRQIRAKKRFANLPVIAMTADAIQGVRSSCVEAGMDDYLTKPINPDELFATLERWIPVARKSVRSGKQIASNSPVPARGVGACVRDE